MVFRKLCNSTTHQLNELDSVVYCSSSILMLPVTLQLDSVVYCSSSILMLPVTLQLSRSFSFYTTDFCQTLKEFLMILRNASIRLFVQTNEH
jgi:hypothetical protein